FRTGLTGSLTSDLTISYRSPTAHAVKSFTIPRADLTGFYNAHSRLLVYHSTLVDESEAMVDLDYDWIMSRGKLHFRLTPHGCASLPDLAPDAGKVDVSARAMVTQHGLK